MTVKIWFRVRHLALGISLIALATGVQIAPIEAQQPANPTTVILVRHAEPGSDDPRDPGLSAEGRKRAESLLDALRDADLAAVYTSQFRRTRETGQVLAEELEIPLHVFEVNSPDLAQYNRALLERVRQSHPGETVLVVGHSNTVPAFVQQATGQAVEPIKETEFDHLFIVILVGNDARVIRAKY